MPVKMLRIFLPWILFCIYSAKAQDGGDIVNALGAHSDECEFHDWQVIETTENCGGAGGSPCSFPTTCYSSEFAVPDACQKAIQKDLGGAKAETTTAAPTETQAPETQPTETQPTETTISTTESTTTSTTTAAITIAPFFTPAPFLVATVEPPLRPLPVGPDGKTLLVFFKQVGDARPTCSDNSNFCCYWAKNGECNDNAYFMQTYCRRSCQELRRGGPDAVGRPLQPGEKVTIDFGGGQTTIGENAFGEPPGGTCQDLHPRCRLWASRGECKRNSLFMISICRPACGLCPPCIPKCQMVCPLNSGYGNSGCQHKCSGCGR